MLTVTTLLSLWLFGPKDWPSTLTLIRERYPAVRQLSTAELAERLKDPLRVPLLIDTREKAEYEVSHIGGAKHAAAADEALALIRRARPNQEIVLYCSVGYRSTILADKLQQQGVKYAANLEGSIFTWANEGRPLVRGGPTGAEIPAALVHPYDSRWAKLLKPELRASSP
jgi:rhodanese-related sulfurtransferase